MDNQQQQQSKNGRVYFSGAQPGHNGDTDTDRAKRGRLGGLLMPALLALAAIVIIRRLQRGAA